MNEPIWLELDIVLDIHSEQLALFGEPEGVRDRGLLESALARQINRSQYEGGDIMRLAAACAFGLARNRPFIDGNKRTAFAAMIVFPALNGWRFAAEPAPATASILALASGDLDEERFGNWLKDDVVSRRS